MNRKNLAALRAFQALFHKALSASGSQAFSDSLYIRHFPKGFMPERVVFINETSVKTICSGCGGAVWAARGPQPRRHLAVVVLDNLSAHSRVSGRSFR
jgi:hypothetical protein